MITDTDRRIAELSAESFARIAEADQARRTAAPGPQTGGHRGRLRSAQLANQKLKAAEDPETTEARRLRLNRDWSQADLSTRALVSRMSVLRFENRKEVGPFTASRIARVLGAPLDRVWDAETQKAT